jgi:glutamate racemase
MTRKRVLAFDSGVGGLSVVQAMIAANVPVDLDYVADFAWLPYGGRPDADLIGRVPALIARAADEFGADLVVIACNTASTVALAETRARLKIPVVGVVPPIKPAAALTKAGVIGVLATPATIARPYTDQLIADHAPGCTVIRVGSTRLVAAAEAKLAGQPVDASAITDAVGRLFAGPDGARLDVVALSCTHFPFLVAELSAAAPHPVAWIDSGAAIARRVRAVLALETGALRLRRAAATDRAALDRLTPTLKTLGFQVAATIAANPPFAICPVTEAGWG